MAVPRAPRNARSSTYERDPDGMRSLVLSKEMSDVALAVAEAGKGYGESIAPVGPTGNYKAGFRASRAVVNVPGQYGGPRAGAVLENTAPHAHLVEFRNRDFVMGRTADWMQARYGR